MLFWSIFLHPFLLLVASCVLHMVTENLFVKAIAKNVSTTAVIFNLHSCDKSPCYSAYPNRIQIYLLHLQSKSKECFSFPWKLSRTCYDWSSKNIETSQTMSKHLISQHSTNQKRTNYIAFACMGPAWSEIGMKTFEEKKINEVLHPWSNVNFSLIYLTQLADNYLEIKE